LSAKNRLFAKGEKQTGGYALYLKKDVVNGVMTTPFIHSI